MAKDDEPGEWTAIDGATEPVERLEFDHLEFLSDLTHPVRGALMRRFREPQTIADVAAALEVPLTRLYHHVNRLEDAGLLRVVATRRVGSATERRYQVVARGFGVAPSFLTSPDRRDVSVAMGSVFDFAKAGLQHQVEVGNIDADDDKTTLALNELRLTPDDHVELVADIERLVNNYTSRATAQAQDDDTAALVDVTLFVSIYQSD